MAALAALALAGCIGDLVGEVVGSGTPATDTRQVEEFSAVHLEGVGDVDITISEKTSVVVETDENLVDRILTEVENGVLVIDIEDGISIVPRSGLTISVATPSLEAIEVSGAGDVDADAVEATEFRLDLSGAGSVTVDDLSADILDASLSGAGSIQVTGVVDSQSVTLSGVGDYDGAFLESAEATVRASGAGSIEVWATESLDVDASGVGAVDYWGNPETSITSTGVGRVEARGDR